MASSVYRVPGRSTPPTPPPWPSRRTLVGPVVVATAGVAALLAPLVVFNLVIAPRVLATPGTSFVPGVETAQDVAAFAMLAAVPVALALVAKRVAPLWQGLAGFERVMYVAAIVLAQLLLVAGAEAALIGSRGGLKLFEPKLAVTAQAPDGRTAYVFRGGLLTNRWQVHVAEKGSLLMSHRFDLERIRMCEPPVVTWADDGAVVLVDGAGKPLEAEPSAPLFAWIGGGC